jgi:hypothetical protein
MPQSHRESEPEARLLAVFLRANASYVAIFFFSVMIELISSGNDKLLLSLEFYSKILSHPLFWFSYIFWLFIVTGKSLYLTVVRYRND